MVMRMKKKINKNIKDKVGMRFGFSRSLQALICCWISQLIARKQKQNVHPTCLDAVVGNRIGDPRYEVTQSREGLFKIFISVASVSTVTKGAKTR
jgi:hypothetical protein